MLCEVNISERSVLFKTNQRISKAEEVAVVKSVLNDSHTENSEEPGIEVDNEQMVFDQSAQSVPNHLKEMLQNSTKHLSEFEQQHGSEI